MIEGVTFPTDLSTWKPEKYPFYLEVFGETQPVLDTKFAEVVPPGPPERAAPSGHTGEPTPAVEMDKSTPIYEYWWTIGHPGHPHNRSHVPGWLSDLFSGKEGIWDRLKDPAARVYMYFPIDGGWRIKELAATLKYLTPTHEQKTLWNQAAQEWQAGHELLTNAGAVAGLVSGNPVVGAAAAGASTLLGALGKLQINNVPQAEGFEWSVAKVTFASDRGLMQGVMWTLPRKVFTELGGRLTGSLAVSFIPAARQLADTVGEGPPAPQTRALLAHAVVYGPDDDHWVPDPMRDPKFLRLNVRPKVPPEPASPSHSDLTGAAPATTPKG